jgi:hypothetical protein
MPNKSDICQYKTSEVLTSLTYYNGRINNHCVLLYNSMHMVPYGTLITMMHAL